MCGCMYGHHVSCSKRKDQPGKVDNPARGQLTGKVNISLSAFAPENLVSRDGFRSPVSRHVSLLISILRPNLVLTPGILPEFRGGVHLLI